MGKPEWGQLVGWVAGEGKGPETAVDSAYMGAEVEAGGARTGAGTAAGADLFASDEPVVS